MTEKIILGGGCFWCLEAVYKRVKGVVSVTSGYSGGNTDLPTYEQVSRGDTGHAEVVLIEFDPSVILLDKILDVFWEIHDPTTLNSQGNDVGTQYRSVIYYFNETQLEVISKSIEMLQTKISPNKVVTQVLHYTNFYPAENYHKNYYDINGNEPYCRLVIDPKIKKLISKFSSDLKN